MIDQQLNELNVAVERGHIDRDSPIDVFMIDIAGVGQQRLARMIMSLQARPRERRQALFVVMMDIST